MNYFGHLAESSNELYQNHMSESSHFAGTDNVSYFLLMLVMISILSLIIFAVYYFLTNQNSSGSNAKASQIAKNRFAKGEINKKELDEIIKGLE